MRMTYIKANMASERYGEQNDCAVKAYSIARNWQYDHVHAMFKEVGRKKGRGSTGDMIAKVMGFASWSVLCNSGRVGSTLIKHGRRLTPGTFAKMYPKGRYICITRNHALAVVDGSVEDWTKGRRNHIKWFIEV